MNKMMVVEYNGELRCKSIHLGSGSAVFTDAPIDNNGKGEAFSPTDLLCTSLACCMITIMGIAASKKEIALGKIEATIEKIMASDPRRVGEIIIQFEIQNMDYGEREKRLLEAAARACPVAQSLNPAIIQTISFAYL